LNFSLDEPPAVIAANQPPAAASVGAAPRKAAMPSEELKQLNTRIPASTHRAFKLAAVKEGVSVQDLLAKLIGKHLAENEL
jgi:predicted HicB family RNase H-like nuclease